MVESHSPLEWDTPHTELPEKPVYNPRMLAWLAVDIPYIFRRWAGRNASRGVRIVMRAVSDLYAWPDGRGNVLTRDNPDLFTTVVSRTEDGTGRLRIGTAAHIGDSEGWQFHGANGIYASVSFEERPLTDAERAYREEQPMYRDAESVVKFRLSEPEALRAAIVDQGLALRLSRGDHRGPRPAPRYAH